MKPIVLRGRDGHKQCHIENPLFLAPMEGVTDIAFRRCVAELGAGAEGVGVMSTQFIRISGSVLPMKVFTRETGEGPDLCPLAVQLMTADINYVAEAVVSIEKTRAQYIDFNFGCPVKRVFNKCAGSAMLAFPQRMHDVIATAVAATQLPITAKIRAGIDDPYMLADILHAVADAGATMICIHARLRSESYAMPAHWEWIAQAVEILNSREVKIPLIGNGAVDKVEDIERMQQQTACDGVMIGRAALTNPFIFRQYAAVNNDNTNNNNVSKYEAAQFIADYWQQMSNTKKAGLGKIKQLLKYYQAGNLFDEQQRQLCLRSRSIETLAEMIRPYLPQAMVASS